MKNAISFRQARELIKSNNMAELERIIVVLEQLVATPNGNMRKGGLIGLAATAIALGTKVSSNSIFKFIDKIKQNVGAYSAQLLEPVLACFSDQDSRVRYFACEALYNIVKICRSNSLVKFDELFNILWNLASDPDQNVRNGSDLMDRLLKVYNKSSLHQFNPN
jgi:vacuole morphology and inheritance protein 14